MSAITLEVFEVPSSQLASNRVLRTIANRRARLTLPPNAKWFQCLICSVACFKVYRLARIAARIENFLQAAHGTCDAQFFQFGLPGWSACSLSFSLFLLLLIRVPPWLKFSTSV